VEKWGRRPTLIGFLVLSALGCLLYAVAGSSGTVAASMLVMSFALLGTWGALYAYTPEIFPTTLRATGMGAAGATARLGGLLAPSLMAPIVTASFALALGLFSGLLLVAAVAVALIPVETRDQPLD
jgi:MFS transporter, putative metabolite:H+ symporter